MKREKIEKGKLFYLENKEAIDDYKLSLTGSVCGGHCMSYEYLNSVYPIYKKYLSLTQ